MATRKYSYRRKRSTRKTRKRRSRKGSKRRSRKTRKRRSKKRSKKGSRKCKKTHSRVSGECIPNNVRNKKLYASIKKKIKRRVKRKGQRWGAYTSGNLVQAYKRAGGKYSGRKKKIIKK